MRNISRKLLLSSLTVVLTVIALGTTTFAWFTITNTARISSFETQIAAEQGIEIAIGIINPSLEIENETKFEVSTPSRLNWVTTLTAADIEQFIQDHVETGFRFEHLTSPNGRTFYTFTSDEVGNTVTNGYVELPIHFRSGDVYTINWSAVNLNSGSPLPRWTSDVDQYTSTNGNIVNRNDEIVVDPSNAVRISFDPGSGTPFVYEKPYGGTNIVLGTGGNLTQEVDPDNDPETENSYIPSQIGAHSYYHAKTNLLPVGIDNVVTVETFTEFASYGEEGRTVLTLNNGATSSAGMEYYGTATIYVWIEGWDANAYNSILDQYVYISFTFKGISLED